MTKSAIGSEFTRFIQHENCTEYCPENCPEIGWHVLTMHEDYYPDETVFIRPGNLKTYISNFYKISFI